MSGAGVHSVTVRGAQRIFAIEQAFTGAVAALLAKVGCERRAALVNHDGSRSIRERFR